MVIIHRKDQFSKRMLIRLNCLVQTFRTLTFNKSSRELDKLYCSKLNKSRITQINEETRIKLRETCRLMMADLESSMLKGKSPEDSIFCYHSSEDRIVLSHALFWEMTKSLKGKVAKGKNLLLIRQYQEEMLEAYLTEDDYFPEILHYYNILYETLIPITVGV